MGSLSLMTMNETDQMTRNEYDFDDMGTDTATPNEYMVDNTIDQDSMLENETTK